MRARLDQAGCRELAQCLPHRRARNVEALRDLGLVERRARCQRATNDLIRKLQPQFLGTRDLGNRRRRAIDALHLRSGPLTQAGRKIVETHAEWPCGSSMMLTWAATIRQPSGKRTQVCIWRPTRPGTLSR